MYKMDLAFNNLQWLMCHKTKPNYKYNAERIFIFLYDEFHDYSNDNFSITHANFVNVAYSVFVMLASCNWSLFRFDF